MKKLMAFFVSVCLITPVFGQTKTVEPQIPDVRFTVSGVENGEVTEDKSIPIGDIVLVNLKLPENPAPPVETALLGKGKVTVSASMLWDVHELVVSGGRAKEVKRKFRASDGDKSIVFGTGVRSTKLQVDCIITWLFVSVDESTQKVVFVKTLTSKYGSTVTIGQMPQPPPDPIIPDPVNPDPVNPTIPDGTLGIGLKFYNLLMSVDPSVRVKVATVLKDGTSTTLNEANANKFKTSAELLKGWNENNTKDNEKLSPSEFSALNTVSDALAPILQQLYKDRKITTVSTYKTLFSEMLAVLEKVK